MRHPLYDPPFDFENVRFDFFVICRRHCGVGRGYSIHRSEHGPYLYGIEGSGVVDEDDVDLLPETDVKLTHDTGS